MVLLRAAGLVTVSGGHAVERIDAGACGARGGFGCEIKGDILPGIASLSTAAEGGAGLIAAMNHAIFAALVTRDAVDHPVFLPIRFLEELAVA